jgi:hypothetical protein
MVTSSLCPPGFYYISHSISLFLVISRIMPRSPAKRRQADSSSSSAARPTKRRGIMPPTTPKKFKQSDYHLKKSDIPEDAAGFKV